MNDDMNKNELVVKSNKLIQASYRLSLNEQRIILIAIAEARRTETGLSEANQLQIRATDYAEMFNVPLSEAYVQLKEAGQTLFLRYVVLYDINQTTGKEDKITVRWVSSVRYVTGEGVICIRFSHDMVPYITRLEKEFTSYKLEKIANMSSTYAIRMYELLMQWGSVGQREIEIDSLKEILMVGDEYKAICDFKKRVINVAMSQINEVSDLTVSYTQRKAGRTVTHLIFTFKLKDELKQEKKSAKKIETTKPKIAEPVFDKSIASMKEKVEAFLAGNERFNRRFPNIAPHIAWGTPVIRAEFQLEFDEWLLR